MASVGGLLGSIGLKLPGAGGGGLINMVFTILLAIIVLGGCGFGLWWFLKYKKTWNLNVEFKIPRDVRKVRAKDGTIIIKGVISKEWGKGSYNAKSGVVLLKRKKLKPVPMKPFDVKRFLSVGNILTVVQVGINDFRPCLDEGYVEAVDDKTGEKAALLRVRVDTTESKAWGDMWERSRKNTYSLMNWVREHGQILAMGIVVFIVLAGFAVLWTRIKPCGG